MKSRSKFFDTPLWIAKYITANARSLKWKIP